MDSEFGVLWSLALIDAMFRRLIQVPLAFKTYHVRQVLPRTRCCITAKGAEKKLVVNEVDPGSGKIGIQAVLLRVLRRSIPERRSLPERFSGIYCE